jgi:hypothetical protein
VTDRRVISHFAASFLEEALLQRLSPQRVAAGVAALGIPLSGDNPIQRTLALLMVKPLSPAERRALRCRFGF